MKKKYIKVKPLPDMATRKSQRDMGREDKIARIYAMAERLHVKIGGKE